jgi:hypothetical protein
MKLIKNKKGSIIDIIVWMVGGFLTLVVLGILVYVFGVLGTELSDIGQVGAANMTNITAQTFGVVNQSLAPHLQNIALIIIVVSALSIMIHNFLVKAHPVFFVTYFIMAIASVVVSVYISNQYEILLSNEVIGSTLQGFTGGNFIMAWLPYWAAVVGIFGAIFLFIGIIRDRTGGIQT